MLHYKACANTWKQRFLDLALLTLGLFILIFDTGQTVLVRSYFVVFPITNGISRS